MNTNYFRGFDRALAIGIVSGFLWVGCLGCGSQPPPGPPRKPTVPVTGLVLVDGQPVEGLEISCHDVKLMETADSAVATTYTDAQGKFEVASYVPGDGVPEGEYMATFLWGELNIISRSYGGPDKLNDRYRSPKESKVKFTVKKGVPLDLGKIELTTK